jgi:hypothetical protein
LSGAFAVYGVLLADGSINIIGVEIDPVETFI